MPDGPAPVETDDSPRGDDVPAQPAVVMSPSSLGLGSLPKMSPLASALEPEARSDMASPRASKQGLELSAFAHQHDSASVSGVIFVNVHLTRLARIAPWGVVDNEHKHSRNSSYSSMHNKPTPSTATATTVAHSHARVDSMGDFDDLPPPPPPAFTDEAKAVTEQYKSAAVANVVAAVHGFGGTCPITGLFRGLAQTTANAESLRKCGVHLLQGWARRCPKQTCFLLVAGRTPMPSTHHPWIMVISSTFRTAHRIVDWTAWICRAPMPLPYRFCRDRKVRPPLRLRLRVVP